MLGLNYYLKGQRGHEVTCHDAYADYIELWGYLA